MAIGVLEPESSLAKIDLARDAGLDHPLQGAVDGGPTDPVVVAAHDVDEIIRAQMSRLPQEDVDDQVTFAGPPAAGRTQALQVC